MQYAGADNILKKTSNEKKTSIKTFDFRKKEEYFFSSRKKTMLQYNNNVKEYINIHNIDIQVSWLTKCQ